MTLCSDLSKLNSIYSHFEVNS